MSESTRKTSFMRRVLLASFLPLALSAFSSPASAQDRFAFAITDVTTEGVNWTVLRKLDLKTGQYSDILLNGAESKSAVYDAVSKKEVSLQPDSKWGNLLQVPFSNGVAAAAYDRDHNRLYYTPMFVDQLRYIDLKTMRVYYVNDQQLTGAGNMHNQEGKIITRMVIAPDGYGYAISNDGSSLIRFSTGKNVTIESLGSLVDAPSNAVSIQNRCTSFGGDMVCDDAGNLFIITAFNNVFKVNVETKVATHLAQIQGLPAGFTSNGAVVDGDGNILVSSAMNASAYYAVDPKTWTATSLGLSSVYKSSDLANGNYIATRAKSVTDVPLMSRTEERFARLISVYPNPVTSNKITIQFNKVPKGDYTVDLTDVLGRSVMLNKLNVAAENQTQVLPLKESFSKGVYMVKVYDADNQSVFTQKVVVQ